jgi:hypothetical protein
MKRILTLLTIAAIGAVLTIPAEAAKGAKKGKKGGGDALAAYDKDANGKIDGTEVDAVKADFTAGKQTAKGLDTNNDGTLSDDEIAAAGAKGKGGKKKKKNK